MAFVNLTPHKVVVRLPSGREITIPPSGSVARVETRAVDSGTVAGIPAVRVEYGPVEGLPSPKWETIYIVSSMVLARCQGRQDVVAPDTSPGGAIRDEEDQIVAVRRLVRAPRD